MTATVSLIILSYNRAHYLQEAIASILAQTYRDFELLIWDDGSTDDAVQVAQAYAAKDCRVTVVAATHQGSTLALKAAIAQTTALYLGWVDDDDKLAPTALAETVAILNSHPEVGLVYTDYINIDETGREKGYGSRCRIPYSKERLLLDFMTFHFRLIRRSVFDQVGGIDERAAYIEDYDLCLRLSEVTTVHHLQKPLYYYRQHDGNLSDQQRVAQILGSRDAIARAIQRQGLSHKYDIEVQIIGRFFLRRK